MNILYSEEEKEKLYVQLEQEGEEQVREKLAPPSVYGERKKGLVKNWLEEKERQRALDREKKTFKQNQRLIEAAEGSRDDARKTRRIAVFCAVVATLAALAAIGAWLFPAK